MAIAEPATAVHITLLYAPAPRQVREWTLALAPGSTVAHALEASGVLQAFPELQEARLVVGIWGRKTTLNQRVHAGDRLELYRSLRVDPKMARRERFSRQGARSAGLFATRRDGAKAGY